MGVDFGSVRAALGTGKFPTALVRSMELTSSTFATGGLRTARTLMCFGAAGVETTRVEGFTPIREVPFRFSLLRTTLTECSQAFARTLERGKACEVASEDAFSEVSLGVLGPSIMDMRARGGRIERTAISLCKMKGTDGAEVSGLKASGAYSSFSVLF